MTLLITGAKGQLGTVLRSLFPDAVTADKNELDITDADAVNAFVKEYNIDAVINCAAYTAVDLAEDEYAMAEKVNVLGPLNLSKNVHRIIHISTDYVFDGVGGRPYTEDDKPNPLSIYGKTKYLGENAVLMNAECGAVIRASWLYSPYGSNFVKTMRRLGSEKDSLNVVFDQVGTPTSADDLAAAIKTVLSEINGNAVKLYHFSNEGVCSWYDFARAVLKMSGLNCHVNPIRSSEYPTKATRPPYSVLDKGLIKTDFGISINHWEESLEKCLKRF